MLTLFRKLAMALQHQLERVQEVRLCFFERLTLGNRRGKLLHEAGVSTLFCWFKYCGQLHTFRLPRRRRFLKIRFELFELCRRVCQPKGLPL
jgi:hypothetical protein